MTKNLFTPEFIIPLEGRKSTLMSAGTESLHLFRDVGTSTCPYDGRAVVGIGGIGTSTIFSIFPHRGFLPGEEIGIFYETLSKLRYIKMKQIKLSLNASIFS